MVQTTSEVPNPLRPEQDANAMVQEMLRDAEVAPEPEVGDRVLDDGSGDLPPTIIDRVESAGHTWLYNTRSGEPASVNNNMVPSRLSQTWRDDGTPMFTTRDPGFRPHIGEERCLLHPEKPERGEYDRMGLPVCRASHIQNEYEVRQHMRTKHGREWAVIEDTRQRTEAAEDRKFQRVMLDRYAAQDTVETVEAATTTPEPLVSDVDVETPQVSVSCETCGRTVQGKNLTGAKVRLRSHMRRVHSGT